MADDPFKYFRVEAREILEQLTRSMLDLENGRPVSEGVQRILRLAHTLKGAARVVKQKSIADSAHAIEDALAEFRSGHDVLPRSKVDAVLHLLDDVAAGLAGLDGPPKETSPAVRRPVAEETFRTVRADVEEMDALIDGITETHVQLNSLMSNFPMLERSQQLQELLIGQLRSFVKGSHTPEGKALGVAEQVRDTLATLHGGLKVGVSQIDRELRQVREASERLRLLPVNLMFSVLERTTRDAARDLGKQARFDCLGGQVRLDAQVLGIIQSALVQLVRNAVAHGVELPAQRLAVGKPTEGCVSIEVARHRNRVSFVCRDDGRGVDIDAVREAARRAGRLGGDIHSLQPNQLFQLLLRGGISTSTAVTEVAGRGVGLDVVREAVARLGGEVHVHTQTGKGTTFEIDVPASLTGLEGLLVEAGTQAAVIPLDAIRATLRLDASKIAHAPEGSSIVVDGEVMPFTPLARSLRTINKSSASARKAWSAVVLQSGKDRAAIGVDRLLGVESIVLRPLPASAQATAVIVGTSADAEGNPRLVLDPDQLVREATKGQAEVAMIEQASARGPILVIDDSLTTRMLERSILESADYEVDTASSAEEGLQKLAQREYRLCLVDVEMPGMNGFELIEKMRADQRFKIIPAILVTSRNAEEDRQRGEAVGAQGYVVKSDFDQGQLLKQISTLMGLR